MAIFPLPPCPLEPSSLTDGSFTRHFLTLHRKFVTLVTRVAKSPSEVDSPRQPVLTRPSATTGDRHPDLSGKVTSSEVPRGGSRTRMEVSLLGILSPVCLPFHHSGDPCKGACYLAHTDHNFALCPFYGMTAGDTQGHLIRACLKGRLRAISKRSTMAPTADAPGMNDFIRPSAWKIPTTRPANE